MSDEYAPTNRVEYLADFPGARIERDLLAAIITEGEIDVTNRPGRLLGKVSVTDTETTFDTDLAAALTANDNLSVVQSGTVTATDDGSFNATVSDDGSFAVSSVGGTVNTEGANSEAFENATALASGATLTNSFSTPDANRVVGRVKRASTSYDVSIDWKDASGNVLFSDSLASGVAAGTETSIDQKIESPYFDVNVSDAGSASGAVTASLYTR